MDEKTIVNQQMEEEITLREIILILLKHKILIISLAVIIGLCAGVYSKLMVTPIYTTKMNIVVNMPNIYQTRFGEYTLPISMNGDFLKLITNNDVLSNTISDLGDDASVVTTSDLNSRISIGTISTSTNPEQTVFEVTVAGESPEEAVELANALYENYLEYLNIMMKNNAIDYFSNDLQVKIKVAENELDITRGVVAKNEELLSTIPQMIDVNSIINNVTNTTDGVIILEDVINPTYTETEKIIIQAKQLIMDSEVKVEQYTKYIQELSVEKETLNTVGDSETSIPSITDNNIFQSSSVIPPTNPSNSNTLMNVMIGIVLGGMLGVFLVFFRAYWKKEL